MNEVTHSGKNSNYFDIAKLQSAKMIKRPLDQTNIKA